MPSRSSRSRPASLTSFSEPSGSASRTAMRIYPRRVRKDGPTLTSARTIRRRMSDWLSEDKFVIDQLIKPMVNLYRISAGPTPIAFVRQKRMAIKEDIRFFADESETRELWRIKARSMMEFSGRYDVTTPEGETIGVLGKVFGKSLLRSTWQILDAAGQELAIATGAVAGRSRILRRVIDMVPYGDFVPIPFHFTIDAGERHVGDLNRRTRLPRHVRPGRQRRRRADDRPAARRLARHRARRSAVPLGASDGRQAEAEAELDPGRASQDPRRLHLLLPLVRLGLALLPRGRGRSSRCVPSLRRRDASPLSGVRSAVPFRIRDRVRGVRRGGQAGRGARRADPQAGRSASDPRPLARDRARYACTPVTARAPSPTAAATRWTDPARTSPAAKTPGRLVSSGRPAPGLARDDVAPVVSGDLVREPRRVGHGADEDDERGGVDRLDLARPRVQELEPLEPALAVGAGDLGRVADDHVRRVADRVDQVLGHARTRATTSERGS